MNLFGFTFKRQNNEPELLSFAPKQTDSTVDVAALDAFSAPMAFSLDTDHNNVQSENTLIDKYRETAMISEVDYAIDEISSEAIIASEDGKSVEIKLDSVELSEGIKKKIEEAFDDVYTLLEFNVKGHDIFRRWYVDGRLYYAIMIDNENPKAGVQELRFIDPKKIKKIREYNVRAHNSEFRNVISNADFKEYYMYSVGGVDNTLKGVDASNGISIAAETICYVNSGLLDYRSNIPLSYLHKALRPAANARMMEDAIVIYRITRAPERRIFYVDVGNLPKGRAEEYMRQISAKYKNKIVYDVNTGEIANDRRHLAMTEDFWIPRRDGSRGTEIDTLQGGENLGQIEDVEYFKKKMYRSLNIPMSRIDGEGEMFNKGTEITRDELRFSRFINRLRSKFSGIFSEILCRHLVLKGIMSMEEWDEIKADIRYDFKEDNHFTEALESELMESRFNTLSIADQFVGKYLSEEYVMRHILRMSDDEIKYERDLIKKEGSDEDFEEKQDAEIDNKTAVGEEFKPREDSDALSESMAKFFNSISKDAYDEDEL